MLVYAVVTKTPPQISGLTEHDFQCQSCCMTSVVLRAPGSSSHPGNRAEASWAHDSMMTHWGEKKPSASRTGF